MKNRRLVILCISLAVVIILALTVSYAIFRYNIIGSRNFKIIVGSLEFEITDTEQGNNVIKENMVPTREEDALNENGYTFTVTNKGTIDSNYTVYLDNVNIETQKERLSDSLIYVNIYNPITTVGTTYKLSQLTDRILVKGSLKAKESITYTLRIWLDFDADNSAQDKYYAGQVRVVGQQFNDRTFAYKDLILNGADPVLTDNLVPVIIDKNAVVRKANPDTKWYSYENKQWANAVVLKNKTVTYNDNEIIPESNIESYFVWIPKYSYKVFDMGNYRTSPQTENIPNNYVNKAENTPIDIRFGTTNTVDSNTECVTPLEAGTSGTCSVGKYMTHPAFITMNSNGLWVGKFETGYEGAAPGNIYDTSRIVVKPNVYSWRNISVGNIFKNSYNYLRNEDSHMMKNTEWGAMAYLTNSIYGTCTGNTCSEVRINNNSNYITGFSGVEEPTVTYNRGISIDGNRVEGVNPGVDGTYTINYLNTDSVLSSTTQNYTGIYDTSGGTDEYVAGYTVNAASTTFDGNNNPTNGDLSGITTLYNDFYNDTDYSKYWDRYTSNNFTDYNKRILGDATGELGSFFRTKDLDNSYRSKSSWNKDIAFFATTNVPWFTRGYTWRNGSESGQFAFTYAYGNIDSSISSRIVLAPRNS